MVLDENELVRRVCKVSMNSTQSVHHKRTREAEKDSDTKAFRRPTGFELG